MKKELIEQEQEASLMYHKALVEGKSLLASYWHRKAKKYAKMKRLAAAATKRKLLASGIKRLNTVKI